MEEFRQLKEALQKMPSFKGGGGGKGQQQLQVLKEQQPLDPGNSQLQLTRQKVWWSWGTGSFSRSSGAFELGGTEQFFPLELILVLPSLQAFPVNPENRPAGSSLASHVSGVRKQADSPVLRGQSSNSNDGLRSQVNMLLTHPAPLQDANSPPEAPPAWPAGRGDGHIIRFTRTVNSLPNGNPVCSTVPGVCFFLEGQALWPGHRGRPAEFVSLHKPV